MQFRFQKKKIANLYTDKKNAYKYPQDVVDSFLTVITIIDAAESEQDLSALQGLRFTPLSGTTNKHQQISLRLNDQWNLIVVIKQDQEGKYLLIIDLKTLTDI